jgi:hypothetical protein
MKKLLILLLAVLLLFSFASCVKDESTAPSETETPDENAILFDTPAEAVIDSISVKDYPSYEYEFSASAYKELGREETDTALTVYGVGLTENYRFEGGNFIVDNLYDYYPFVTRLTKRAEKYEVAEHISFIFDYTESSKDYHDYFPAEFTKELESFDSLSDFVLTDITGAEAQKYLESIGRQAKTGTRPDFEEIYVPDAIEKEVPQYIIEKFKVYPELKGFPLTVLHDCERIEDGVRYVYKCEYESIEKLIIFTKYEYDSPEKAVKYYIDAKTGEFTDVPEPASQAQTAKPETVTASKPQPDIDDKWGVALTFDCKDGKGGRLTFTQSTEAGRPDGELITGAMYKVEAKDDGYWTSYENYVRTHYDKSYKDPDLIFTMIAYSIPLDGEYSEDIDFTNTYGELKPGTYRIIKTVTCGTGPQREERTYYAEFTVE